MADHKIKATYTYFVEDPLATCEEKYQEALDFMAEVLVGVSPPPDPAAANGLNLADKDPMSSDPIDIIIGADLYGQLLLQGVIRDSRCVPTAQSTALGWILSGPIQTPGPDDVHIHHLSVLEHLDHNLRRFWDVEELPTPAILTPDEQNCERHFAETHSRTSEGPYIVRLPFRDDQPIHLGASRSRALSSLRSQENRLKRDPNSQREYQEFLSEYQFLGHMRKVDPPSPIAPPNAYYIPHHPVIRQTNQTTRLRVVFNASSRTSNGKSLNQHLHSGPKFQQDLIAILIRCRQFQYVYAADIEKMYRQILVHPHDVDFQRILWRESPSAPIDEYQLLTVTYGTTPAPYLALRVLIQLIVDECSSYPDAVEVLSYQAYVDDILFGSDDLTSLRLIRNQTILLVQKGGFSLRKWASNDSRLLSDIDEANHGLTVSTFLQVDENISVLGLTWDPVTDQF
ncbi:uncharacterized protein LOC143350231 [Colletes latitarsis]|uniref:uncharacterized protein LOC143350231 n=1 Tax=Colletes latitarsis TaxID=2605962 RepID=UPI0040356D62